MRLIQGQARVRFLLGAIFFTLIALSPARTWPEVDTPTERNGPVIEVGKFLFYGINAAGGEETYEIRSVDRRLVLTSRVKFPATPPLLATLEANPDFSPQRFEVKGNSSSDQAIDVRAEIEGNFATSWDAGNLRKSQLSGPVFTVKGPLPVSIQMMLIRYWACHGRAKIIETLPGGAVRVELAGEDSIQKKGKTIVLKRYNLRGLAWGTEWVWTDSAHRVVAVVGNRFFLSSFEAVREGFESAQQFFLVRAVQEGAKELSESAKPMLELSSGVTAIVGGTLIDGTGIPPIADSAVLIRANRIVAAGSRSQINIPHDARIVDARGKTVLPGLWDMHTHYSQLEFGLAYLAVGVTTVRDCGNEFDFIKTVRDGTNSGRIPGPHILLAGAIDGDVEGAYGNVRVKTPGEARAAVRRYHGAGFEQIKLFDNIKAELVPILAAEAHRLGMTVTGHVPEAINAFQGVAAGFDQIEHIYFLPPVMVAKDAPALPVSPPFDEVYSKRILQAPQVDEASFEYQHALRFFREHQVVIDPTLENVEVYWRDPKVPVSLLEPGVGKVPPEWVTNPAFDLLPAAMADRFHAANQKFLSIVRDLHRAGVAVIVGTDRNVLGPGEFGEIERLVRAGFTPMEAIQAATIIPARVMKLDHEVGTIEAGKRADLIVVDGNPLENISNIRKVKTVIANGRVYDSAKLWESIGFKP